MWGVSFFTIWGDGGTDYNLLGGLYKTECYALSNHLISTCTPGDPRIESLKACIEAQPTDGLGVTANGGDEAQLGMSYANESRSYERIRNPKGRPRN